MDFGKIPHFHTVNFDLPVDSARTSKVLAKDLSSDLKIYLGAPVWANRNFVGKVYPDKTQPKDYLHHYAHNFESIELNTTHYQIPSQERVDSWISKVPPGFKFCPKFPQTISHATGDFSQQTPIIESFLKSLEYFGDHLGISFIQFSDYFDFSHFQYLKQFIERFPQNVPLAIELRNTCWFQDNKMSHLLFDHFEKHNISTVMSDVAGRRDVLHMRLTTKKAFIRFTGNSLHQTDYERLDQWFARISEWQSLGLEELYFFLHQPDESLCVELALYLAAKFKLNLKSELITPKLLKKQEQLDLLS